MDKYRKNPDKLNKFYLINLFQNARESRQGA